MAGLSRATKLLAILGLPISAFGFSWLLFSAPLPPSMTAGRLGLVCATLCCDGIFVWSCATIVAYLAVRWNWEPASCMRVSVLFMGLGTLAFVFGNSSRAESAGSLIVCSGYFMGYFSQRLAFPKTRTLASAEPPPRSSSPI
jgi:hypothetical protein